MLCWPDIFFSNARSRWVGGSRLGGDGKRVSYGQCGCETTRVCSDVDGCVVQGSWVDGVTMPASTSWLQGGLDEVGGSGREWVSSKASPSDHGMWCPCSSALVLLVVCVFKCLLGRGARSLGNGGCLWCEVKGELLYCKWRTSEEIVVVWKKTWMLKHPSV